MLYFIIFLALVIITFILLFKFFQFIKPKEPEAELKLNFIDFKNNNFYDTFSLLSNKSTIMKKMKIKEKNIIINIYGFKNKEILEYELNLINSKNKKEKNFIIKLYKNSTNVLNIKINNNNKIYYNSEIIFYTKCEKEIIKLENYEFCKHNSKNRKRLLIYNVREKELRKIINKIILIEK